MDLAELESFITVAKVGSFTKAAIERHLTQPAISRHIQRLERELAVILLTRHRGSVKLTGAGQSLLTYAQDALERHLRFVVALKSIETPISGELLIAASTTPGEFLVPGWVAGFTGMYPNVHPRVFVADSAEVIKEVRERRWEVGFVGTRIPGRDLMYEEIAYDEVVLAIPDTHPFARRSSVSIAELRGQPFLERERGSGTLSSFRAALSTRNLPFPQYRVVMVLNSTNAILSAVRSRTGLGLVSILALENGSHTGVAYSRITELPRSRPLYLVRERHRPLSSVSAAFTEWVRSKMSSVYSTSGIPLPVSSKS